MMIFSKNSRDGGCLPLCSGEPQFPVTFLVSKVPPLWLSEATQYVASGRKWKSWLLGSTFSFSTLILPSTTTNILTFLPFLLPKFKECPFSSPKWPPLLEHLWISTPLNFFYGTCSIIYTKFFSKCVLHNTSGLNMSKEAVSEKTSTIYLLSIYLSSIIIIYLFSIYLSIHPSIHLSSILLSSSVIKYIGSLPTSPSYTYPYISLTLATGEIHRVH